MSGTAARAVGQKEAPNAVDVHVGSRIRMRRQLLGMSQEQLGRAIGLTFQQIQKYEHGTNRVSASRLYDMAEALEVPISFFFEELPDEIVRRPRDKTGAARASIPWPSAKRRPWSGTISESATATCGVDFLR